MTDERPLVREFWRWGDPIVLGTILLFNLLSVAFPSGRGRVFFFDPFTFQRWFCKSSFGLRIILLSVGLHSPTGL